MMISAADAEPDPVATFVIASDRCRQFDRAEFNGGGRDQPRDHTSAHDARFRKLVSFLRLYHRNIFVNAVHVSLNEIIFEPKKFN